MTTNPVTIRVRTLSGGKPLEGVSQIDNSHEIAVGREISFAGVSATVRRVDGKPPNYVEAGVDLDAYRKLAASGWQAPY